jgi:hypothetical protein
MKWNLVSNASIGIKEYQLIQDGVVLVVMKYSPEQQSIRITFEGEHHVFFLENAGYANRIIFKNAYGVDLGKFSHNRNNTGRIEINNEVYNYNIVDNNQPKLIVHHNSKQEPLAVCQIPEANIRETSFHEQAGIVLSVCRYATMPAARSRQQ